MARIATIASVRYHPSITQIRRSRRVLRRRRAKTASICDYLPGLSLRLLSETQQRRQSRLAFRTSWVMCALCARNLRARTAKPRTGGARRRAPTVRPEAARNRPALGSVNSVYDGSSRKVSRTGSTAVSRRGQPSDDSNTRAPRNRRQRMRSRKLAKLGSRRRLEGSPPDLLNRNGRSGGESLFLEGERGEGGSIASAACRAAWRARRTTDRCTVFGNSVPAVYG